MAKFKIIWSFYAQQDLKDILEFYIERNGNKKYSIQLNSKIRKTVSLLSETPYIGIATKENNVRIVTESEYQIVYALLLKT